MYVLDAYKCCKFTYNFKVRIADESDLIQADFARFCQKMSKILKWLQKFSPNFWEVHRSSFFLFFHPGDRSGESKNLSEKWLRNYSFLPNYHGLFKTENKKVENPSYGDSDLSKETEDWRATIHRTNYLNKDTFCGICVEKLDHDLVNFTARASSKRVSRIDAEYLGKEVDLSYCDPVFITPDERNRYSSKNVSVIKGQNVSVIKGQNVSVIKGQIVDKISSTVSPTDLIILREFSKT